MNAANRARARAHFSYNFEPRLRSLRVFFFLMLFVCVQLVHLFTSAPLAVRRSLAPSFALCIARSLFDWRRH